MSKLEVVLAVLFIHLGLGLCQLSNDVAETVLDTNGCDLLSAYNILSCYSTGNDSEATLISALQQTANWTEVHLILNNYAIDQLSTDIFSDVNLSYLFFSFNCSSHGIPTNQLLSITSPLSYLEFVLVYNITKITQSDLSGMPFNNDLTTLNFQLPGLNIIEDSSFAQFGQLKSLSVSQSSLSQLTPGVFQGLTSLRELTLVQSAITTLPQGLFASTPQLRNLFLDENKLQTLANGTMNGLDQLQFISVAGNPFICDCSLQWFKDWLISKSFLETSGATCQYPINAPFADVNFCPSDKQPIN
ncbi:Leucine-rich repeats and immunoglobulin-like domains [Chamberlinius hualienensis]